MEKITPQVLQVLIEENAKHQRWMRPDEETIYVASSGYEQHQELADQLGITGKPPDAGLIMKLDAQTLMIYGGSRTFDIESDNPERPKSIEIFNRAAHPVGLIIE